MSALGVSSFPWNVRNGRPTADLAVERRRSSEIYLFSHLQGIVDFNSKVSYRAFELGMSEE